MMKIETYDPVKKMMLFMDKKLSDNSHKTGWDGLTLQHLSMRITQEKKELVKAIKEKKCPEDVWEEAADVANFAMMLAQNYEDNHEEQMEEK